MYLLIALVEWFIVLLIFTSVVGAVKMLGHRRKYKSFIAKTLIVLWITIGFIVFFILFGHATSGHWLWSNT